MPPTNISDAEWQVMQVIWERQVATAADVIAALKEATRWQRRTIRHRPLPGDFIPAGRIKTGWN